jgi:hypothetical protein
MALESALLRAAGVEASVVVVVAEVVAAAARVLERVRWRWWWWWQPLSRVVQRCDDDAPGRPPPTACRRRQEPLGRTTAATAATPGLSGAQVGPYHRPNLLREHLFVLHLLTEACFVGPGDEVGFAAADGGLARPSSTTTVTAVKAAPTMAAVAKAAVATNRKTLAATRAAGKGPERSGMGTKRQSMTKSFTA